MPLKKSPSKKSRKAHREERRLVKLSPPAERIFQDRHVPGPLIADDVSDLNEGQAVRFRRRRVVTRACMRKLKWWYEEREKENKRTGNVEAFPWKTTFADGSVGPVYLGNGNWGPSFLWLSCRGVVMPRCA
ncbi:hypothetical protein LZ554_003838 [Drepanopeziza brunnea f. sp. 'monogermtubi']|nr:hypothetical protein LZ554_003838 [Drepanopeziza brunnea f. sp. 'monogermtubi']